MEYWLYLAIGAAVFAALIVFYIWQHGLFGSASEARIRKIIADLDVRREHWQQELEDRIAERTKKDAAGVPTLTNVLSRTDSIGAAHALLQKGAITQAQYEKLRDDLMK